MSKRLSSLALLLGLVAAACSTPSQATVEFGSGTQFVPEVADSLNDAGLFPSVVTTDDGQPYVAAANDSDRGSGSASYVSIRQPSGTASSSPIGARRATSSMPRTPPRRACSRDYSATSGAS